MVVCNFVLDGESRQMTMEQEERNSTSQAAIARWQLKLGRLGWYG